MSDDSEVTALIKELLILNRAESTPTVEPPVKEVEGRKSKREETQARTLTSSPSSRREKVVNLTSSTEG
jgi:hypothetical protein